MSTVLGYLIDQHGKLSGLCVAVPEKGLVIGRDPKEADLVISHTLVSRKHAKIAAGRNAEHMNGNISLANHKGMEFD